MKKQITSMMLVFLMTVIMSMVLTVSVSADDITVDGITYTTDSDSNTAIVAGYTGSDTVVVIPEKVNHGGKEFTVTAIGNSAFYFKSITSITIPDSVTSIGDYSFNYCNSLNTITIPDSVTSIGNYSFNNCNSLNTITIPDSVTSIGTFAFFYCTNLEEVTLSDNITSIGEYSFNNCNSLKSITIPDSVTSIDRFAFYNCTSLTTVNISPLSELETIAMDAFRGTAITRINLPKTLKTIGEFAFFNTGLTEISIPDGVSNIDQQAFYGCPALESVVIEGDGKEFGMQVFFNCSALKEVIINGNGNTFGSDTFNSCATLSSITVIGDNNNLGDGFASFCPKLEKVTVIGDNTKFGIYVFNESNALSDITIIGNDITLLEYSFIGANTLEKIHVKADVWEGQTSYSTTDKTISVVKHTYTFDKTADGHSYRCTDGEYSFESPVLPHDYDDAADMICNTCEYDRTPIYTVTLNTNGGNINEGDILSYAYGTGAVLPTDVTKDGFTFGGWYADEECTGEAVTAITATDSGDKEFWAKWDEVIPEPEEPSVPEYMKWLPSFLLTNTKYSITAEAGEGGFITPEGTTKVQFGMNITYSITPMDGYAIKAVYIDGKNKGAIDEYTFEQVITEHSISVEFELIDDGE